MISKHTRASILLFFIAIHANAQFETTQLNVNNVTATVNTNGLLFNDFESSLAGFEVPAGSGLHTVFASQLWIGGMSLGQELHLAADKYGSNGDEFYQGPLSNDGMATTTSDQMLFYDRFWEAHRSEVLVHQAYYSALQNGTVDELFPDGYTIPAWMLDWPAHGNQELNQAFNLAPFVDVNQNLNYDPENGDYPHFPGDVCIYYIMNDKGGLHMNSGGEALGVEIHVMVYAFNASEALGNSIFVSYRIVNRSSNTYTDCYVGNWTDLDIGTPMDDYIACDVANGFFYGYNGDAFDEASAVSPGYGMETPIQAVIFLGGPSLESDGLDNELPTALSDYETYGEFGPGYGDGIVDNERLGMSAFMYYNNSSNPVIGEPNTPQQYYNLMSGNWLDGSELLYGGNGLIGSGVTNTPTNYAFPGTSDPEHYATGGSVMDEWSESSAGNISGDRRGLAASGPFVLSPGEVVDLDICFLYANEGSSGIDGLTFAQNYVSQLRSHYNEELIGKYELGVYTDVEDIKPNTIEIGFFPNPCHDQVRIQTKGDEWINLEICDITGQIMERTTFRNTLNYSTQSLPVGIYTFIFTSKDQKSFLRVIKE